MFQLSGYKVAFKHDRPDLLDQPLTGNTTAENGSTICMILDAETNNLVSFGYHKCEKLGCFNKNRQRKLAMAHALQSFDRESRTLFWQRYFDVRKRVD